MIKEEIQLATELVQRKIDDLDGTTDETGQVVKLRKFSFGGVDYEIDLTDENWDEFAEVMARYISAGRKAPRRQRDTSAPKAQSPNTTDTVKREGIRRWAREQGYDVGAYGKIPRDVVAAYDRVHRFGQAAGQ